METSDELVTPGCPNCAIKHLSAALAVALEYGSDAEPPKVSEDDIVNVKVNKEERFSAGLRSMIYAAKALVNVVEASEGYRSHVPYAIGLMVLAEETAVTEGFPYYADSIREVRLAYMTDGNPATAAMGLDPHTTPYCKVCAHIQEAERELPEFDWETVYRDALVNGKSRVCSIQNCIEAIRREYFVAPGTPEKGGEEDMAKKGKAPFGKKDDPKAAKAAQKGGCAKGKKGCK